MARVARVLINFKFELFIPTFFILAPNFSKITIEKYGKTPNFSDRKQELCMALRCGPMVARCYMLTGLTI